MSETKKESTGGVGFLGLLTIVFIVLKLTNNIHWSWWWVLAPIWMPILLIVLGLSIWLLVQFFKLK